MSKTTGNVVNPLDLVADVGVDGFRYYVLADTPYGNDGDFTYEGLIARYNTDLANNLGNLLARVATVVEQEVRRRRSGAGRRLAARPRPPHGRTTATAAAWADVAAEPRPRGDVEPDPGDERPPRGERAVEGRARRGGRRRARRRARGAAHRRRARSPALPATAQDVWERIGLTGAVADQRVPADAGWGGYPGGSTVTRARRCSRATAGDARTSVDRQPLPSRRRTHAGWHGQRRSRRPTPRA